MTVFLGISSYGKRHNSSVSYSAAKYLKHVCRMRAATVLEGLAKEN